MTYDGARVPGGLAGTRSTVKLIKQLIRNGSRDWIVRRRAMEIVQKVGGKDTAGEIAALFDFMSSIPFRNDPHFLELVETPQRALAEIDQGYGFGFDCDGYVATGGALLRSIGIPVRIVLIGDQSKDSYQHIYLHAYNAGRAAWISFDPSVPGAPLGWEYSADQIACKWLEPFTVEDELSGPFPAGQVERHAVGQVASLGAGLAGLRGLQPVAFLGDVLQRETEDDPLQVYPHEMESRQIDYSSQNQELYILLTRTDINPRILRRRFGFRRSPEQRRIWRKEFKKNLDYQSSLERDDQVTLGADAVKVPKPGHTDGNSVAYLLENYEFLYPSERPPDWTGDLPISAYPPSWSRYLPNPADSFGTGLWNELAASILLDNLSVDQILDTDQILTGRNLMPDLHGTDLAKSIFVTPEMIINQAEIVKEQGLGEVSVAAIIAILAAIAAAIQAVGIALAKIIEAARDVADPIVGAIAEVKARTAEIASETEKALEDAHNTGDTLYANIPGEAPTGREWLEELREIQEESIALAMARDNLDRFYRDVALYGFDSEHSFMFREAIAELITLSPMFYLLAKERTLRDLRRLKIMALGGAIGAEAEYYILLDEMRRAGTIIQSWADQYADQPFDLDHIEIPGAPDPNPPDELPDGNWPYLPEDEKPENPYLPEDEINHSFEDEKARIFAAGLSYAGAAVEWAGKVPPRKERQRIRLAPGISVDIAPGAGGIGVEIADDGTLTEAGRREAIEAEKGYFARHPVATTAGVAAFGFGLFKLIQRLRG